VILRFNADVMTAPDGSSEQVKTFKWTPKNAGVPEVRMRIAAAATVSEVRVVSLEESAAGRGWTKIEVTVAGDPSQIREFDEEVHEGGSSGGSGGGGLTGLLIDAVVEPMWKVALEKWHKRRDPPLPERGATPGPGEARTTVSWTWERMLRPMATPSVRCAWIPTSRDRRSRPNQRTGLSG